MAIDKSTPTGDMNQAMVLIKSYNGERITVPIDPPLVHEDEEELTGGTGRDLADQIVKVLKDLKLTPGQMLFMRGNHNMLLYLLSLLSAANFEHCMSKQDRDKSMFLCF